MVTRKSIAALVAFSLGLGLLLTACSAASGGETPTIAAPLPPSAAPPSPTVAQPTQPPSATQQPALVYKIVDTGQSYCYNDSVSIACPQAGEPAYGQDAQYAGNPPLFTDNGDGTVTDMNTSLVWVKDPGAKMTYDQAVSGAAAFNLGGFNDWRLPTVHELASLVNFSGVDPTGCAAAADCPELKPFIDTNFFTFQFGDPGAGERLIDAPYLSSTPYVGPGGLVFGVNFADGQIKGYPSQGTSFFVRYVRGLPGYGTAQLADNGDGTLSDQATGLTWMQTDSQQAFAWADALAYCENLTWAGQEDWRLPNAKELYSIVDASRAPDVSNTAAAGSLFQSTPLINEAGKPDYGYYWTSTTHLDRQLGASEAVYVSFGRALGYLDGVWTDVHGAGALRADPKSGDPQSYPQGGGPQGEAVRILNFARCVRGGASPQVITGGEPDPGFVTPPSALLPTVQVSAIPTGQPPEAFEACQGKQANTPCQYEWIFGKQDGVCNDMFGQLVCMPGVVVPTVPGIPLP